MALEVSNNGNKFDPRFESPDASWIDVPLCEDIITKDISIVVGVDGSEESMAALQYVAEEVMQRERKTFCQVVHVTDHEKKNLPPKFRSETIRALVEARLTGAVSNKRFRLSWIPKDRHKAGHYICEAAANLPADYICLGFVGRKGRKEDRHMIASNTFDVMTRSRCTAIVIKDETPDLLPMRRPTVFVVSAYLNKSSTRAFLDVLRLSKPNDTIHVVYVKSYMETADSEYTVELRKKYSGFFQSMTDETQEVFSKFGDREVKFCIIDKQLRESNAQAVVRYADEVDADFIAVGANIRRIEEGKSPISDVSLQICMETDRNFIVSHWVDIAPQVFDKHVRPASRQR